MQFPWKYVESNSNLPASHISTQTLWSTVLTKLWQNSEAQKYFFYPGSFFIYKYNKVVTVGRIIFFSNFLTKLLKNDPTFIYYFDVFVNT